MNKQLDLLITLRDNCNVIAQTLLNNKDVTGDTLPKMDPFDFEQLIEAEDITRTLMYRVTHEYCDERPCADCQADAIEQEMGRADQEKFEAINCGNACGFEPPYGFVPEADCPVHDKETA